MGVSFVSMQLQRLANCKDWCCSRFSRAGPMILLHQGAMNEQ
jgi:hypothetical protein